MRDEAYAELVRELRHQSDLAGALRLLEWDQETYLPSGAVTGRARQIGALAALLHERKTAPSFLDLVDGLADDLPRLEPAPAVDVRETKWRLDRQRQLDAELVRERSMLHAEARAAWVTARRDDDFAMLAPYLERIVEVERRVAARIDSSRAPYEILLEGYEPGASAVAVASLFDELRRGLVPLVERLRARLEDRPLAVEALRGRFPLDRQRRFNQSLAASLGFDFDRGRLDEAAHPFTTSIGEDVRITTRYDESDLRYALYSTIHEAGHALYEQGLDREAWGLPRGRACSLAVHESQSRLWENMVGRSEAFWRWLLPVARQAFPELTGVSQEAAVLAANEARPSMIRTEADEITYNLHIILRFDLERSLIAGDVRVADLPAAWHDKMREYLGVGPTSDREGVLQDVHWASGAIGYFPTYALGNLYAAELMRAADSEIGDLEATFAVGDFRTLLVWLRDRVHRFGQTHRAAALITAATGAAPTAASLLAHLQRKLERIEAA